MSETAVDITRQRIIGVLAYHGGGWIDNGKPNKCRCNCGHRPQLGEFHGAHVADAIMAELANHIADANRMRAVIEYIRHRAADFTPDPGLRDEVLAAIETVEYILNRPTERSAQ